VSINGVTDLWDRLLGAQPDPPALLVLITALVALVVVMTLLLWVAVVLLLAILVMIRNVFGAVSIVVTTAIVLAVSWYATPQVQAVFAYTGVWFLLIGGVRPVRELQKLRSRGRMPESDADQLAHVTHLPAIFWVAVFGLVNLAALVLGVLLLAGQWLPQIGVTP
jgi:hypothetical protein